MKLILITVAIAVIMILTLGASSVVKGDPLVAHAETLSPTPFSLPSPKPVEILETPQTPSTVQNQPMGVTQPPTLNDLGLAFGFIIPGTNCTLCVAKRQVGNAGSWRATHSTPQIGDTMIFRAGEQGAGSQGHVGQVVGIRGNTVYLKHCAWRGGQTAFRSTGKFY